VATLPILSQADTELSLQPHLDLLPDLVLNYNPLVSEGHNKPLMMAQTVPHQTTDKKRVKVYELRNNDWFDRGTGFCAASFFAVRPLLRSPPRLASLSSSISVFKYALNEMMAAHFADANLMI
jgi:hypothetical protein